MFEIIGKAVFIVAPGLFLAWVVFMALLLNQRPGGGEFQGVPRALDAAIVTFLAWVVGAVWWLT